MDQSCQELYSELKILSIAYIHSLDAKWCYHHNLFTAFSLLKKNKPSYFFSQGISMTQKPINLKKE